MLPHHHRVKMTTSKGMDNGGARTMTSLIAIGWSSSVIKATVAVAPSPSCFTKLRHDCVAPIGQACQSMA